MADQNFWFPSQTGSIHTKAGNLRIKIYYDDGGGASNTDVGADVRKLSPLDIPFEISPSGSSYRLPSMQITFNNPVYDATNNVFEQYSILNGTYDKDTFIKIYLDGSEKWHGIIDFSQIKKDEYYLDGSNLKYRKVVLKCYDALAYFWWHDVDLSDINYSDEDSIKTTIDNILAEIGIATGDIIIDSNLNVNEECGNDYDATTLLFYGLTTTDQCRDFLKEFMLYFCCWIYNYGGKFYVNLRNGGTTKAITTDYLCANTKKIENGNPIEYLKIKADMDWSNVWATPFDASLSPYEHKVEYGDSTVESAKQLIVDATDLLTKIYIDYGAAAEYPAAGTRAPTSSSSTYLEDTGLSSPPNNFFDENIESGMKIKFVSATGNQYSHIEDLASAIRITFTDISQTPQTGGANYYHVKRNPGVTGRTDYIYKVHKLIELVSSVYNDFFMTSKDIYRVRLRDISEFDDFTKRFTLFGNNHRAKAIRIYFDKDELTMDLVQVT